MHTPLTKRYDSLHCHGIAKYKLEQALAIAEKGEERERRSFIEMVRAKTMKSSMITAGCVFIVLTP